MSPSSSNKEFNRPPVLLIWTSDKEESRQVDVNVVDPVQRHSPFMHAPFLLQWKVHGCFISQ